MSYTFVFYDTETTGTKTDDRILEIAYCAYKFDPEAKEKLVRSSHFRSELINPQKAIHPVASATHGYRMKDVENAPIWANSHAKIAIEDFLQDNNVYFVAHNAPFDKDMMHRENVEIPSYRSIDTYRLAKHYLKDIEGIESYGLQPLRYFFNLDDDPDCIAIQKEFGVEKLQPHTALSDIIALIWLMKKFIKDGYVTNMQSILSKAFEPLFSDKVTFGNIFEKGSPLTKALCSTYQQGGYGKVRTGLSYYAWAMENMDALSIEDKVNISYFVMKLIEEGSLNPTKEDVDPFIKYAAAFLPQYYNLIRVKFKCEPSQLRSELLDEINKSIVLLIESNTAQNQNTAQNRLKDLELLNAYYNSNNKISQDTPPW
ncbi:exonuclease domain-containing protein [Campylobacter sp. MOP7]|uniref:3'-5' exonuclease n=1 Tax=Campylobacter canis TaxID=3378588 RepID=UPI00387E74A1